ncbi:malonic semialdehyde reductase [Streptomyces sp. NPDC002734]|uniref:malonic semialdehyde reductase n=1 Tax=Streptomyces sp. NPDC002734 TaxID=3154426 RepID=UPI0033213E8B
MSSPLALDTAAQDLLFRDARTANTFTDEPVSDETVQAVYDLVKYAPTAFNLQSLRVLLVRSDDARARLVSHMAEPNREKTQAAPLVAVLAADLDFHEELPRIFPVFPELKDAVFSDFEIRERAAKSNATLQLGYFILGLRAAGLSAGPMVGFDGEAIDKEFFGDGKHNVIAVVNIGKPGKDAWFPRLPRLEYDEVFTTV